MTFKEAVAKIKKNWNSHEHSVKDGNEAVWIAKSDIADEYEVDEEWIGIKGDGSFVWAYASGCSCWDGEYSTKVAKTIKSFNLVHKWLSKEWEEKIIKFAKTKKLQKFVPYSKY